MSDEQPPPRFPRDKDELIRDLEVAGRLRDIRNAVDLKQQLAPKWWETGVGVLQFGAALGLLASLVQYANLREDPLGRLIVFWAVLTILALVLGFEFLILKLYHLRRAHAIAMRLIDALEERVQTLEKGAAPDETGEEEKD